MRFWKYHGIGNDFILVEDFEGRLLGEAPRIATQACHRNFGIGGDGLVLITQNDGMYTMRIFNSDGSEAEMCGNAIRCVAHHLIDKGYAVGETVIINTISGAKGYRETTSMLSTWASHDLLLQNSFQMESKK